MATLLDKTLLDDTLESLPGWQTDCDRLWRDVQLDTDTDTDTELRRQIEVDSSAMGHAPTYEDVEGGTRIVLRTEEAGGVTELDVMMASHISDLVHRLESGEPGVEVERRDDSVVVFRAGEGATGDEVDEVELARTNTAMLES